ncbi:MAG: metallophosphoesterase family protein [Bryobacteraceae bacterium]
MRIAIVSDIHGHLAALEAVVADLRETAPDLVVHGGDLADGGPNPAEVVDRIRDLGWPGVLGNTDEMHTRPESLEDFARQSTQPRALWDSIRAMAKVTREALGNDRVQWLSGLPLEFIHEQLVLIHASPGDPWRSPGPAATDEELERTYAPIGQAMVVYGHIHHPFVRRLAGRDGAALVVANSGSVGLPHDGDPRPSYLLLDDFTPAIRRVAVPER